MNKKRQRGAGKQRAERKNPRLRQHKRSVLLICMVLVVMSGVLAVGSIKLNAKNARYKAQEEELAEQIREEEKRAEEVEEFEEYVKTDDYIKDTAEEKLDLVDPNEILFKPAQ